jgi:mono/diheme cytochrome c family protein
MSEGTELGDDGKKGAVVDPGAGAESSNPTATGMSTNSPSTSSPSAVGAPECVVQDMLTTRCVTCHAAMPIAGAPMSLVTLDDLTKPAISDATKRVADVSLVRISSTTNPMPPAGLDPATADQIGALAKWIADGYAPTSCTATVTTTATNPFDVAPTCTANTFWTGGNEGSSRMHPGDACIACHQSSGGEAPSFAIAGTVYPSAHEPSDCNGAPLGSASVQLTGADGSVVTLTINSAGNFYYLGALALPFQAAIVANGRTRAMATPQSTGDCNSCHTQDGANGAPGRIILP